jgi:hypothetical protein
MIGYNPDSPGIAAVMPTVAKFYHPSVGEFIPLEILGNPQGC